MSSLFPELPEDASQRAEQHSSKDRSGPALQSPDATGLTPADDESSQPTVISSQAPATAIKVFPVNNQLLKEMLEGRTLGHFRLDELVGGGGMGAVFRGVDLQLGRTVAIKVLSPSDHTQEDTIRRFQNEAQSAAQLDHENIARVYFSGEQDGWQFIAFEFIEGQNVRDLVQQQGPLPLDEAIQYVIQIAEALDHSALRDIVHRDIKPSNIIVTPDGRAKLVDMGLARFEQLEANDEDLTSSGMTLGTFDYISPEQATNPRLADVRSDIYSLGCTFYHMLVGAPPYPGGAPFEKLLKHKGDDVPDVRDARPDLPESVTTVLNRMLAKSPSDRYQHPQDVVSDLRLVFNQDALGLRRSAISPSPTRRRVLTHLPWLVPCLLLIAVAAYAHRWPYGEPAQVIPFKLPSARYEPNPDPFPQRSNEVSDEPQSPPRFDAFSSETGNALSVEAAPEINPPSTDASTGNGLSSASDSADGPMSDALTPYSDPTSRIVVAPQSTGPTSASGERQVKSLREAILLAGQDADVDTIELRYNGWIMPAEPMTLNNHRLLIRAANGCKPVVSFRPIPFASPNEMIRVIGSSELDVRGVQFELDVSDSPSESWALFQLQQSGSLRLSDSVVTLRGSRLGPTTLKNHVAVIDVSRDPFAEFERGFAKDSHDVRLEACIIRGEASLVRMRDLKSMELNWNNGLFVSTEELLRIGADDREIQQSESLVVNLRNVTAASDGGLLTIATDYGSGELTVDVVASRSVFISPDSPLVTHRGFATSQQLMNQLAFSGDDNAYLLGRHVYRVEDVDGEVTLLDFDDWRRFAREPDAIRIDSQHWVRPEKPAHEQNVGHYRGVTKPDGKTSGFLPSSLPTIVEEASDSVGDGGVNQDLPTRPEGTPSPGDF